MLRVRSLLIIFGSLLSVKLMAQPDPFFPTVGRNFIVTEFRQSADSATNKEAKWELSLRSYDGHGNLYKKLIRENARDTLYFWEFEADKKGIVRKSRWYNTMLSKWVKGDVFLYKDGEPQPHTVRGEEGYSKAYSYDKNWRVTEILYTDNYNKPFGRTNFQYEAKGNLKAYQEYEYAEENAVLVKSYVYKMVDKPDGSYSRELYLLPGSGSVSVTRQDTAGNITTSFYPNESSAAVLVESLFYDTHGTLQNKYVYNKNGVIQFVDTYQYLYIDK